MRELGQRIGIRRPERIPPKETEVTRPIKKVFIDNRGEIAVRFAREFAKRGIAAVVPYTFTEDDNIALRMARERVEEGWEIVPLGGTTEDETYKNRERILEEAIAHGCDTIALGYGFLAEDAKFVAMCEERGVRVLAPPSRVMRLTGNKIRARNLVSDIDMGLFRKVPIVPGTGNLKDMREAVEQVERIGYPVMLKDADTGGGSGNKAAHNREDLETAYDFLKSRAECEEIFAEQLIGDPVHVEVQILGDKYGNVISLGERDCTMQRRSQKLIEESPSPNISSKMRRNLERAAVLIGREVGYEGAGTVEFIIDRKNNEWYFMEMNPRIQVEHGVSEEQTKVNIVAQMINVAEGRRLRFRQKDIKRNGHTIEARIYAENPDQGFEPSPGTLSILEFPEMPGIRLDEAYREGDSVSQWFDPTIAKALAHAEDRTAAISLLDEFLASTRIAGAATNVDFLRKLLATPEFYNHTGSTTFVESWWNRMMRGRVRGLESFINGGEFELIEPEFLMDPDALPQNVTVPRRSGKVESYLDLLEQAKLETGSDCAAEYGIVNRDGVSFVLFNNDYGFRTGTLGVGEALVFRDAVKLAAERNLPLVTIFSSAGVEQGQNSTGLEMMNTTTADLTHFKPPLHINIYRGPVYGGVPAGPAGAADIQMGIDDPTTKIGFTGPYPLARGKGYESQSSRAQDVYPYLEQADEEEFGGLHSTTRHLQSRNIDIAPKNLEKASEKVAHMIHILGMEDAIYDPTVVFHPHEDIGYYEASASVIQFNRPGERLKAFLRNPFRREYWRRRRQTQEIEVPQEGDAYSSLPITERLKLISDPDRPTTLDLLDTESGIFEDVVLLSESLHIPDGSSYVEQYPSVVAALARIDEKPVMVIGHQTQLTVEGGKRVKEYSAQTPADWEYTERMMGLARKFKLPIIFFSDSMGADPMPGSEDHNQSHKISRILTEGHTYPYPIISIGIGFGGSGGAKTLLRPVDAAADLENAVTFVSQETVQYWIESGRWIVNNPERATAEQIEEMNAFLVQLADALPEVKKDLGQIDEIIKEGLGGAAANRQRVAQDVKRFIISNLRSLSRYPSEALKDRRYARTNGVRQKMAKTNPAYSPPT